METDGMFMFCQNELPYNSFIAFEGMRKKEQFCDMTIKVQNHTFTVHRMILAAGIPYFNSVFTKNAVDVGEIEFTLADLDPGALESLIHFAYTGKVIITMENVNPLLVTSQFLQLNQVLDSCVEFISKRLSNDTVFKVRTFASGLNNSKLIENCNLYIRNNFEEFSKCVDFLSLPHFFFKKIIAEDDLMVTSEDVVFDAVMKWIKASPSERHVVLPEMLNEVRLIYLSLDYFIERVDFEDLISSSVVCRNLVKEAKTYLMLPEKRSEFSNLKVKPRRHYRHELFAFCSCNTCGYSVHHLVNETWRQWSSKQVLCDHEIRCVVGVNDKIYIFLDETIETFCITSYKWKELTTAPKSAIKGSAVVPFEDKIYFFGSFHGDFKTKLRCFDTKLNQWQKEVEMKTMRYDSAGASLKESIYVTGGYDNNDRINTVEKYSPSTGQWIDVASMLTKRDDHGCTALNEEIYVCGGRTTGGSVLNTAEVYDPNTNQWNYISFMAKAHSTFTLISDNNRIYALHEGSDMEVYDPKHNEWKCLNAPGGFRGAVMLRSSYIKSIPD